MERSHSLPLSPPNSLNEEKLSVYETSENSIRMSWRNYHPYFYQIPITSSRIHDDNTLPVKSIGWKIFSQTFKCQIAGIGKTFLIFELGLSMRQPQVQQKKNILSI
jgi:hypothetical protein